MKATSTVGLLTYALFVQQAASTSWGQQPVFSNPENSDNKCTVDQDKGFNWDKLPTGSFGDYGGIKFGGFDCKDSFQPKNKKRGLQTRTNFKSKCIQGTLNKSGGGGPKISSGEDKFSITDFDISVAFDIDLDLIFSMPDGSKCKHTAPCKADGTTVKNTQCGGAKEVTFQLPPSNNKKDCDFGIHSIRFDCQSTTKTSSTTTRATSTTSTTVKTTTTPVTTTTTVPPPPPPPVTTTSTATTTTPPPPPVTTTTTTTSKDNPPPPPVTTTTTTTTTKDTPPPPPVTTTTTTSPTVDAPPPPSTTTTTTSKPGEQPPPPPVTTTTTTSVEQPPPPPVTTTTTTSKPDEQPPPPPVTTTTTTKPNEQPPPPPVTTTTTTPLTTTTTSTTTPPTTLTSFTLPPPDTSSTTISTTSSLTPPPPPPTDDSPCPPVLPRCLNTWLGLVSRCKSNSDLTCFCPDASFISSVQECVSAWATSDTEITGALSYLAGICADFVPQNPGICTGIPPTITLVPQPVPVTETVIEATNGNGRGPRPTLTPGGSGAADFPITIVTFTRTVDGKPVPTAVTVPQVTFITTTAPASAPTGSDGSPAPGAAVPGVGLVPFVPALATGNAGAVPSSVVVVPAGGAGPATATATDTAIVAPSGSRPTGTGAAATTGGRTPDVFTGGAATSASVQSIGFAVVAGALAVAAFLI